MALMWYEMSSFLLQEQAAEEILHSNRHSLPFGLQLTKQRLWNWRRPAPEHFMPAAGWSSVRA